MATKRQMKKQTLNAIENKEENKEKETIVMGIDVEKIETEIGKAVEAESNKVEVFEEVIETEKPKAKASKKIASEKKAAAEKKPVTEKKAASEKKTAAPKKTAAAKTDSTKAAATKPTIKEKDKPVTEKKSSRKSSIKTSVYIQFGGNELECNTITDRVKEIWTSMGNKASSIKSIDIYVKPEENATYYVINGDISGKLHF